MHPLVKLVLIVIIVVLAIVVWGRVMGRKDPDRELVGLTDTVRARVSREISAGHKINAIKIYRAATGAPLTDEARSRISELILAGRREDAMSLYAEATGASGAEAQAIIRTWDTTQNY